MNIQSFSKQGAMLIGEPSFADAIATIKASPDLSEKTKLYWSSGLTSLADYLGEPPETIPGRIAAITHRVHQLNPEKLKRKPKTVANTRALVKQALNWFNKQTQGTARSAPMAVEYRRLWEQITDRYAKDMLSPLFRYLTGIGVLPADANDDHVASYFQYRLKTGFRPLKKHQLRQLVRYWNDCRQKIQSWPDIILTEPTRTPRDGGLPLDGFQKQLLEDIEAHFRRVSRERIDEKGRVLNACSNATIELRRRMIFAAIRMAVRSGIPIASLDSLDTLLKPAMVKSIIEAYWRRDGKIPRAYTIDLGAKFLTMARAEGHLAPDELAELSRFSQILEGHRKKGLTPKNREVVRHALQDGSWARVVNLPRKLMAIADAKRKTSPLTSAILAQMAIAIRILLVAPVRIENLSDIKLGENLVRPGGPKALYFLTFERYDVKNDISLDFELDKLTTELIDRYILDFRPQLMRGRSHSFLIPGITGDRKGKSTFGEQISECVLKHVGVKLTPHQFRHCAAALLLTRYPGNYELVRQVLGHKKIETTISYYIGLETIGSTRIFGSIVTELDDPLEHIAAVKLRRTSRYD